jgi:hypothetical protein
MRYGPSLTSVSIVVSGCAQQSRAGRRHSPKQGRAHESTRAKQDDLAGLLIGCFGASTGAPAALVAAARAPTLLIVGGRDGGVLELNRQAFERLRCPRRRRPSVRAAGRSTR